MFEDLCKHHPIGLTDSKSIGRDGFIVSDYKARNILTFDGFMLQESCLSLS